MINNGRIKGLDYDYVYVGDQVIKKGKRGWSFRAERYWQSRLGFSFRCFSATVLKDEWVSFAIIHSQIS
jgi:hypothetical protein